MDENVRVLAEALLRTGFEQLPERDQRIIKRVAGRIAVSRDLNREFEHQLTPGQRLADRVAAFGGSWSFMIAFAGVIAVWVGVNSLVLARFGADFDPYPYILLNLGLSMLAAIQAPVILMAQNRQAAKDRLAAEHDYEVNLKAELEILRLHEKLDQLQHQQWAELVGMQKQQIELLISLLANTKR